MDEDLAMDLRRHPRRGGLRPKPIPKDIAAPERPQFLRGCISMPAPDRELQDVPRAKAAV